LARASKSPEKESEPEAEEAPYVPTPVWVIVASGAWYLCCLDVAALFVKPLDRWISSKFPQEVIEEDDNWKPSLTTIPFGPYLAAGAIVCMLFGPVLEEAIQSYWKSRTGQRAGLQPPNTRKTGSQDRFVAPFTRNLRLAWTISRQTSSQVKPIERERMPRSPIIKKLIC
jgi:hypothetical protein